MNRVAASGMAAALLAVCVWTHAQPPDIHFMKTGDEASLSWARQWEADIHGLNLFPQDYNVYPLDKDTAFFFGSLRTPAASVSKVLPCLPCADFNSLAAHG